MTSSRPVTFLRAIAWLVLIVVFLGLFLAAVKNKMPAHLIIILFFWLSRLFRGADEDEDPARPPMRSFRLAPLRPPMVDSDHPLFDRELDGGST